MSRLRVGSAWLLALLLVAALVGAGLVVGNRNDAEASQIRAEAAARSRTSAHELAVRQQAAAEVVARREAAVARADARRAARARKVAEAQQAAADQAARERAAQRRAAREQAAQERAARRQAAAAAAAAAKAAAAAAKQAAAGHDLTGTLTAPDVDGALVTRVGAKPGQPVSGLGTAARAKLARLRDQLAAGHTFPCPEGAGGSYSELVAGATVTVRDGTGAVLATTELTGGTLDESGCAFAFRGHVPDADAYQVQVGRWSAPTLSRDELDQRHWALAIRP